jgi:hypothetical protein
VPDGCGLVTSDPGATGAPWTRALAGDQVVVVVSDLHLPVDEGDPGVDQALARWGDELAAVQAGDRRLVLLGDTAELMLRAPKGGGTGGGIRDGGSDAEAQRTAVVVARAAIRQVLRAHPAASRALRRIRRSGWSVEIVPGNHDAELSALSDDRGPTPPGAPRARLAGTVSVRPWIVREEAWFYAEHGHQLHDVNAFRDPLRPFRRDGRVEPTIGRALTLLAHAGPVAPSLLGRASALVAVLGAMAWHAASPRPHRGPARGGGGARASRLENEARETGLEVATLAALQAASTYPLRSICARLLRTGLRAVTGRVRRGRGRSGHAATSVHGSETSTTVRAVVPPQLPAAYAPREAARRLRILRASGDGTPFLVMGHTHALGILPLPDDRGAWLVTTGSRLRPPDGTTAEEPWLPVAVLWRDREAGEVGAEVGWWDGSRWRPVSRVTAAPVAAATMPTGPRPPGR